MDFLHTMEHRWDEVFFAPQLDRAKRLPSDSCFAYYTTAETAMKILKTGEVWMRSPTTMNDYSEVRYGFNLLDACLRSDTGKRFSQVLDALMPGLHKSSLELFNGWWPEIQRTTHLICVSEHDKAEDDHGRLSMWRAYGSRAGVALVFNGGVMALDTGDVGIRASPVRYLDENGVMKEFTALTERMETNFESLKQSDQNKIQGILFLYYLISTLCTKHPGFSEEREWRIIASPKVYKPKGEMFKACVESIDGTPQRILKLDLGNHDDDPMPQLQITNMLKRVIVGPCEYPVVTVDALAMLLQARGFDNPHSQIAVSGIPLRV